MAPVCRIWHAKPKEKNFSGFKWESVVRGDPEAREGREYGRYGMARPGTPCAAIYMAPP